MALELIPGKVWTFTVRSGRYMRVITARESQVVRWLGRLAISTGDTAEAWTDGQAGPYIEVQKVERTQKGRRCDVRD